MKYLLFSYIRDVTTFSGFQRKRFLSNSIKTHAAGSLVKGLGNGKDFPCGSGGEILPDQDPAVRVPEQRDGLTEIVREVRGFTGHLIREIVPQTGNLADSGTDQFICRPGVDIVPSQVNIQLHSA